MHGSMLIEKKGWLNKLGAGEEGQISLTGELQILGVDTPSRRWGLPPTPPHTLFSAGSACPHRTKLVLPPQNADINHVTEIDTTGNSHMPPELT